MKTIGSDTLAAGSTIHKFEQAGLGKAPYVFTGLQVMVGPIRSVVNGVTVEVGAPGQPMGSCHYCGTGIKDAYWLKSADGKEFYVGCDCINKAGDKGLMRVVKQEEKKKRDARNAAKRQKALEHMKESREKAKDLLSFESVREQLAKKPHPMIPSMTLLDYVEFVVARGGHSGVLRALDLITKEGGV